jgi:RNA-directed DNA polymerase
MQEGEPVKDTRDQNPPPTVPAKAAQGGEVRARWAWAEDRVWTERMLEALETGIKGGRWFCLIDKVMAERTLQRAWEGVASNGGSAGVDGITVQRFDKDCQSRLFAVKEQLQARTYRPLPVKRVWIDKPGGGQRPLGVPTVRDRVVQNALRMVIEPIFERQFAEHSYGFRPQRGCKDALRRVDALLHSGHHWVVDADLKSYFDTIPHGRLMEMVREHLADGRVLELIEAFLKQGIMEELKHYEAGESGTPQGAVISPLLANIYLNPLDHQMARAGYAMVRYADDFVILCRSRQEAEDALRAIQQWVEAHGLRLHPEKTRLVDARERGGFDFLGYHFERGHKWPRKKSMTKLRDTLRRHTRRTSGESLRAILERINPVLAGWYGYFKHGLTNVLADTDRWLRGRLRSILRKREGRKGRGRGNDHQRYPNSYFEALGVFNLEAAKQAELRPSS